MVAIRSLSRYVTPNVRHGIKEGDWFGRKFKLISKNLCQITLGKINRVIGLFVHFKWMNNSQLIKEFEKIPQKLDTQIKKNLYENPTLKELRDVKVELVAYINLLSKISTDQSFRNEDDSPVKPSKTLKDEIIKFDRLEFFAEFIEARESILEIIMKLNSNSIVEDMGKQLDYALLKVDTKKIKNLSIDQINDLRSKIKDELRIAKQLEKDHEISAKA